jgi:two-component system cell cycle response regulator CtrA
MGDREYIAKLKEENAELLEENYCLRAALAIEIVPPSEWGLTPHEAKVMGCLARHELATFNMLFTAVYLDKLDPPDMKLIAIYICKIRRKLKPFGVEITNKWGVGYSLDAATRARLTQKQTAAAAA